MHQNAMKFYAEKMCMISTLICINSLYLYLHNVIFFSFLARSIDLTAPRAPITPFPGIFYYALRIHAYSNILKILPPKNEHFQIKYSVIFHISAQNIDCGYSLESPRRSISNEYPQSMFLSRNKKNNVYPCKLQFYYLKVGFKGVKII